MKYRSLRGFRLAGPFLFLALVGCEKLVVDTVVAVRTTVQSTVTSVEAGVIEPMRKASLGAPIAGRIAAVHCTERQRVAAGDELIELENDMQRLRRDEALRDAERLRRLTHVAADDEIERAEFAYERANTEYELTRIKAPFSGLVAEVNARVGEVTFGSSAAAAPGAAAAEPLVYLVDDSRLHVEAEIDEADVQGLQIGQTAKIRLGGIDRRLLAGRLSYVAPVVSTDEQESRTAEIHVELLWPAAGDEWRSAAAPGTAPPEPASDDAPAARPASVLIGMSADVEILVAQTADVLAVPTTVVLERGEERFVFVVRDGRLVRQSIRTGLGNFDLTEVREGLVAGDLVVIPGDVKTLVDGAAVEVRGTAAKR